jgi:hypothetical protein
MQQTPLDDLPLAARNYKPDPELTHRHFVPKVEVLKLIRDGAPRAEIEKLCRFGGCSSKDAPKI